VVLAFFEAMRRVNAGLLVDIAARLDGVAGAAAALLAGMVRGGRAWSDLALQTHYGADEPGIWHADAANSLLHLAVSVLGTRALLSVDDGGHTRAAPRRATLPPGSVYCTSPALFRHAVEYADAPNHGARILAVQARFLIGSADELGVLEDARADAPAEWAAVAAALSGALAARGGLALPTLGTVLDALAELTPPSAACGVRFHMLPAGETFPAPPTVSPREALVLLRGGGGAVAGGALTDCVVRPPRFAVAFPRAPAQLCACVAVLDGVARAGAVAEYAFPLPAPGETPLARAARLVALMFEERAPPFPLARLRLAPEKAAKVAARNHCAELFLWASAHGADVPPHAPLWRSEDAGGVVTEGSATFVALRTHFQAEIEAGLAAPCAVHERLRDGGVEDPERYLFDAAWRGVLCDVEWALALPPRGLGAKGTAPLPGVSASALEKARELDFGDVVSAIETARNGGGGGQAPLPV
jgi:hypothetical protein